MKVTLAIIVKNEDVTSLDCCETDGFIRLSCGSTLSIETKILKRLLAILEKEKELDLKQT